MKIFQIHFYVLWGKGRFSCGSPIFLSVVFSNCIFLVITCLRRNFPKLYFSLRMTQGKSNWLCLICWKTLAGKSYKLQLQNKSSTVKSVGKAKVLNISFEGRQVFQAPETWHQIGGATLDLLLYPTKVRTLLPHTFYVCVLFLLPGRCPSFFIWFCLYMKVQLSTHQWKSS